MFLHTNQDVQTKKPQSNLLVFQQSLYALLSCCKVGAGQYMPHSVVRTGTQHQRVLVRGALMVSPWEESFMLKHEHWEHLTLNLKNDNQGKSL